MRLREGYYALQSLSEKDFALLDTRTAQVLKAVQTLGTIRLQAVIQYGEAINTSNKITSNGIKRDIIKVSINLYGLQPLARKVGATLTQEKQFLQHPDVIDPLIKYDNPQYFKTPDMASLDDFIKPRFAERILKGAITSEVGKIIDSLDVVNFDWDIPATDAILTPLLR